MLIRKKKKKCFPISLGDDSVAAKVTKRMSEVKKQKQKSCCAWPFWRYCWQNVKNNPEKPLIFVTLAELKWKACVEEIFFF